MPAGGWAVLAAEAADARRRLRRRRLALAAGIIALGILAMWPVTRPPAPPLIPPAAGTVVFVDTAGWYRRTPDEVAAISPFDLSLDGLPAGLPMEIGAWRGSPRAHDPAVDQWFRDPDVVIERTYLRADGERVWLSAFGSRGDKSFHLFEHTPETCYPMGGWLIDRIGVARLARGPRPLPVNQGLATGAKGRLAFMYWYVWPTPARDTAQGVLSIRLAAPVRRDPAATLAMLAEDFMPALFPRTLAWSRF